MLEWYQDPRLWICLVSGGLAGSLLMIVYNHYGREKRLLGYRTESVAIALHQSNEHLKMQYRGIEVNALYSHRLTVKNVGNRTLEGVTVTVKGEGPLIDLEATQLPPLETWKAINDVSNRTAAITLPMLKPNEKAGFSMLVMDSDAPISVLLRHPDVDLRRLAEADLMTVRELFLAVLLETIRGRL